MSRQESATNHFILSNCLQKCLAAVSISICFLQTGRTRRNCHANSRFKNKRARWHRISKNEGRGKKKKANLTQNSGHRCRDDARSLHRCPSASPFPLANPRLTPESDDTVYSAKTPPRLTSRHGEKDVPVCLVTSQTSWFGSLPSNTPVMLLFKKLPVHHKHPPFYVPRLRRERKERNQPSLKHKLTALSRLTWHQRSDVPDIALNFHNKVTPQLLVTQWDHSSENLLKYSWICAEWCSKSTPELKLILF